jgi:uncharacterized membrane protein YraQ (UPF0718 family)
VIEHAAVYSAVVAAIFVEAMPFLVMGALLSAAIEVFVPTEGLVRFLPKNRLAAIGVGILAGVVLPTCECGVVLVVRRLIRKGVPPCVAVAYMLAAPIVNPVVLASTWFAFPGRPQMVLGRVLGAVLIAGTAGLVAGRAGDILRQLPDPRAGHGAGDYFGENHAPKGFVDKLLEVLRHGGAEFIEMGKFLILGAIAAGLFKTMAPQGVLEFFSTSPALQIFSMMILAVLLSVCSEADSFVASSFQGFSPASQLAFITLGPMLDLKLIGMYAGTFRRGYFWFLMLGPAAMVFVWSVVFGMMT